MSAPTKEVSLSKRVEIRVTPEDFKALKIKSKEEGKSIGFMFREAMGLQLECE